MEANVFISKLKADGSKNDLTDMDSVYRDYIDILAKLPAKDSGNFSLNVLCIMCRNLEKIPSWRAQINNKSLLTLTIECVRETNNLDTPEQVKTLACIYHIQRQILRQNGAVPPEMVLKLSYIPFDTKMLLNDYCKTYWNILADRISYIEKLKTEKCAITKLLPKLTEDLVKVIKMYNSVQFCSTILTFLVKKLHFLYNNLCPVELSKVFGRIFEEISLKTDLKLFKKLPEKELLDVYVKLNDCLYVIAENSSKNYFKDSILNIVIQSCITLFGHYPGLLHCFQTIFLNGICSVLTIEPNLTYTETVLSNLVTSCETAEKIGYTKAMNATYPYLNQFLRLYIEFNLSSDTCKWQKNFPEQIQEVTLNLMKFVLVKLKNCQQILKCENCTVKSGSHDALRLSFLAKNFISKSLQEKLTVTKILPAFYTIVLNQYNIMNDLCTLNCNNYEKCFKKLQADVHNTAILLNKSQDYDHSIKLFDIYLKNEISHFKCENNLKNISRALYNKSICELDSKSFQNALSDAYLSLIFAYPEGLTTEKYMSLVMDIKAKSLKLKSDEDDEPQDDMQMMTVLDACAVAIEEKKYGNLKPFFCNLKFSELLKHEFSMYAKLWPSIVPVAGVWKSLYDLTQHDVPWITAKDENIQQVLYEIILQTPSAVRTIQNENYIEVINDLLESFDQNLTQSIDEKIVYGTILFLKAEYDLAEACIKHGWKVTEPSSDPDQNQPLRTIPQEHEATRHAIRAVQLWTDLVKDINSESLTVDLKHVLQILQVFVPQLLHLYKTMQGLQLAHICCQLAVIVGDKEAYIRNAGTIVYNANKQTDEITEIIRKASGFCKAIMDCNCTETILIFMCDCVIFYNKIEETIIAAKLIQVVQAKVLKAYEETPDINLDLATGRLLEAQWMSCGGVVSSSLSGIIGANRHFITVNNSATTWCARRLRSCTIKLCVAVSGAHCVSLCARLLCWRRGRAAAAGALAAGGAVAQGGALAALTNTSAMEDAQIKLDNRLKYILGLQPSTDEPIYQQTETKHNILFTPKQDLETMLENLTFKRAQTSPLSCVTISGCKIPEFLSHSNNCICYACDNPFSIVLACKIAGLEASMYFRAKEFDIAKNYFDGAQKCLHLAEGKLKMLKENCLYDKFIVDLTVERLFEELKKVELEVMIELAFFELAQANFKCADEYIVRLHEILEENKRISPYLRNEVLNLLTTSARLRKTIKKVIETDLEADFESLKLTPTKITEPPKTPEPKAGKPPKITKIKVKDEEVPNTKRRVIKLNLDNSEEKETSVKNVTKKTEFKIPVPVTVKPVLESITPVVRRKKPEILVTPADVPSTSILDFATPKPNDSHFSTPLNSTTDQFFTPMSTLKTYSKKSLRKDIVKNLESEFSTPTSELKKPVKSVNKENLTVKKGTDNNGKIKAKAETGSVRSIRDKRSYKRALSPGKLEKEEHKQKVDTKPVRSVRLRQPLRFSVDEEDKK